MSINVNAKRAVVNAGVFLLAMAGLMSCSSDELLTQHLSDDTVTFTSHVTRADDATWESGDNIGVYMVGGNPASYLAENKSYTTTDGSANFLPSSSADALSWPKDGSPVKFQAYYPYSATAVTNGVYKIDISNQSKALDLMYAPADKAYTKADGEPALAFSHQITGNGYVDINRR